MRAILLIALAVISLNCLAEEEQDYVRFTGLSAHSTGGNNPINQGFGFEKGIDEDWSAMVGVYRNSEWNYSWYGAARYAFYKEGDWNLGVGVGVVTGYKSMSPLPMVIPDFCYKYYCFLAAPKLESSGSNVVGVSIRLPIQY